MSEQQTEGLPLGTRLSRIARVKNGTYTHAAVLESDNVYGVLDLTTVPIPVGYKRPEKDWFRLPEDGEWYLTQSGSVFCSLSPTPSDYKRIILEPIKRTQTVVIWEYEVVDGPSRSPREVSREIAELWVKNYLQCNIRVEEREVKP